MHRPDPLGRAVAPAHHAGKRHLLDERGEDRADHFGCGAAGRHLLRDDVGALRERRDAEVFHGDALRLREPDRGLRRIAVGVVADRGRRTGDFGFGVRLVVDHALADEGEPARRGVDGQRPAEAFQGECGGHFREEVLARRGQDSRRDLLREDFEEKFSHAPPPSEAAGSPGLHARPRKPSRTGRPARARGG